MYKSHDSIIIWHVFMFDTQGLRGESKEKDAIIVCWNLHFNKLWLVFKEPKRPWPRWKVLGRKCVQLKLSGYHFPVLDVVISPDIITQIILVLLDFIKATKGTKNKSQGDTVFSIDGGKEKECPCEGMKIHPYLHGESQDFLSYRVRLSPKAQKKNGLET